MPKRKDRDRGKIQGGFIPFTLEMLNSLAYRNLNGMAAKAFMFMRAKVKKNGPEQYQDVFIFSYREAKKLGFNSATLSRAIDQLISLGFIDVVRKGGCMGEFVKVATEYRLSQRWKDYGTTRFVEHQSGRSEHVHGRPYV